MSDSEKDQNDSVQEYHHIRYWEHFFNVHGDDPQGLEIRLYHIADTYEAQEEHTLIPKLALAVAKDMGMTKTLDHYKEYM